MSKAISGSPSLDRDVVQRFVQARDTIATAVAEVLGDESVVRNLGQNSLDGIETSLRETRIAIDRGLLVFARWRTVRGRQSLGGTIGPILRRVGDIEEALTAPDPGPRAESTEPQGSSQPTSIVVPVEETTSKPDSFAESVEPQDSSQPVTINTVPVGAEIEQQ
jgi:hypothetical protein